MNILSLFDWISCGRLALERAWIQVDKYFASEIDKYAIQIAKKNYPDTIHVGSVTDISYSDWVLIANDFTLPEQIYDWYCWQEVKIDMIIWGSPCQDLSIAKKDWKGLQWEKSWLFFEYVRILREVRPKWFLLENVASMKKVDKEEITRILTEIYPDTQCYIINSALVSAQNRKRLYWTNIQWVEQPEDKWILLKDILQDGAEVDERMIVNGKSYSLTASYNWAVEWNSVAKKQRTMVKVWQFNSWWQWDRVYSPEWKSVSLSANGGGRGAKTGLYEIKWVASRTWPRNKIEWVERVKQYEIRKDDKANSITTVQTDSMVKESVIRKLTPIECERLQTLPDNYTEWISNTQRYKAIWNGWTVDVIAHIFSFMNKSLIQ